MKISRRGFFGRAAAITTLPVVLGSVSKASETFHERAAKPVYSEWTLALLDEEGNELIEAECPGYSRRGLVARKEGARVIIESTGEGEVYKARGDWQKPFRYHAVYCGSLEMYRYDYKTSNRMFFGIIGRQPNTANTTTLLFKDRRVLDIKA